MRPAEISEHQCTKINADFSKENLLFQSVLKFNHVSFLGEIVGNVNYIDIPGRVINIKKLLTGVDGYPTLAALNRTRSPGNVKMIFVVCSMNVFRLLVKEK